MRLIGLTMLVLLIIPLFLLVQGCAVSGGLGTMMHVYEIASLASHAEKAKTAITEHRKNSEDSIPKNSPKTFFSGMAIL